MLIIQLEQLLTRKKFKKFIKKINKEDIICVDESCINGKIYAQYGWYPTFKRLVFIFQQKNYLINILLLWQ